MIAKIWGKDFVFQKCWKNHIISYPMIRNHKSQGGYRGFRKRCGGQTISNEYSGLTPDLYIVPVFQQTHIATHISLELD